MEKQSEEGKQKELDREASQNEQIRETGQAVLDGNFRKHKVELLTVIGEIEGHESAPSHSKTTKYEHVLPKLALIEDDEEIEGLLILLNTVGGDVEAGLAIAEMIAGMKKPTVSDAFCFLPSAFVIFINFYSNGNTTVKSHLKSSSP